MRNWSIGYEIIRTYVRFGFWLTHKKIVVTGHHHIPKNKPIIFAPNHQNALMDPLALVCTNSNQSYWLARADIFKTKAAQPILRYLRLIPVYRIRDGKENLSNNKEVFERVVGILENKQTVALFPEAGHSGKRQMLPHKKAIPRIALEAEEKNHFKLNLQIVPVGIYYSHYRAFNRVLIVRYGNPISVDKYQPDFMGNPQKAMLRLRDEIREQIVPLTVQINSEEYYEDYENILQLVVKTHAQNHSFHSNSHLNLLESKIDFIRKLEHLENNSPEIFKEIRIMFTTFSDILKDKAIADRQIENANNKSGFSMAGQILSALLLFPLFLSGAILNLLPFGISRTIIGKKVKDPAFISTFNFVTGLIVFPLFYVLEATAIHFVSESTITALVVFILMPFVGKIAYSMLDLYTNIYRDLSLLMMSRKRRSKIKELAHERQKLIEFILSKVNF